MIHFSFYIHDFKLKTEVFADLNSVLVIELNKRFLGLLHFPHLNLTISCRWIFLSRTYACFEGNIFVQEKKTNILKLKVIKNVHCCFNTKTQYSFILDDRSAGKEVREKWRVGKERVPK